MVLVKFLGNKVVDLDLAIIENLILPQYADEEIAFSFPFHFQEFFLKDPFDLVENEDLALIGRKLSQRIGDLVPNCLAKQN